MCGSFLTIGKKVNQKAALQAAFFHEGEPVIKRSGVKNISECFTGRTQGGTVLHNSIEVVVV